MIVLVALSAALLVGMVGLSIDTANVRTVEQELQASADAAALAAAHHLSAEVEVAGVGAAFDVSRQKAADVAAVNKAGGKAVSLALNSANAADGDIVVGVWDPQGQTFTPTLDAPNAVRVVARRAAGSTDGPVDLLFGGMLGMEAIDVVASSTAMFAMDGVDAPALLHVMHPTGQRTAHLHGDVVVEVKGKVQCDANPACALKVDDWACLLAERTDVCGTICTIPGGIVGGHHEGSPVRADDMGHVLPDDASWDAVRDAMPTPLGAKGRIKNAGTYTPGNYPNGLVIDGNEVVHLEPGRYCFGGPGIKTRDSSAIFAEDVTIMIDYGSSLTMYDNSCLVMDPPGTGVTAGISVFHHRKNAGKKKVVRFETDGLVDIEGCVYAPQGRTYFAAPSWREQRIGRLVAFQTEFSCSGRWVLDGSGIAMPGDALVVEMVE